MVSMSYNYSIRPIVRYSTSLVALERETGFAAGSKRFEQALEKRGIILDAVYDSGELEYDAFAGVKCPEHEGVAGIASRLQEFFSYAEPGDYTITDERGATQVVTVA